MLTLHMFFASPPCRATLMLIAALGLNVENKVVDLFKGEQMNPEFLKINPQHTVPTLVDDNFVLWDSHAINGYLVDAYAKNDSLYPKDIKMRAKVDQMLYFDDGILFPRDRKSMMYILTNKGKPLSQELIDSQEEAYGFLNTILEGHNFLVGNDLTIADMSCMPNISTMDLFHPVCDKKFPNVHAWMKRIKEMPFYKPDADALEFYRKNFF